MPKHPDKHLRVKWPGAALTPATLLRGRFTGLTIVLLFVLLLMNTTADRAVREVIIRLLRLLLA